ncbi:N-formylglutamate amidohydrolase [Kangiella sp.]|uniref:N-formylglutamate amidohydrolase n=1 Tax=Kangiella sp. TaxID=1920245 RepID=UPI003A8EE201
MNINKLIEQFEAQSIAASDFNHRNHLRVAWFYINHYSINIAREKVHQGLIKLTKALGAEDKYHRSLTDFFVDYLLQVKWYLNSESWDEVEARCGFLMNDAKSLLNIYYSPEVIGSEQARTNYVEPDKLALDRATLKLQAADYPVFDCQEYHSPIIVSMPHHGQFIPNDVIQQMQPAAYDSADTDWYLVDLYSFLDEMGITRINANYSRYLIDLNRDKSGEVLYAGADNTELCPTSNFDREPLYTEEKLPTSAEIKRRVELYWQPYHDQLVRLIKQAKQQHGFCLLFEAHTIQSEVPRFFEGQLPDFNFGTNNGATLNEPLTKALENFDTQQYSKIINGRFKGGYITRHYADPENQIYCLQLELSQITYLNEQKRLLDKTKTQNVQKVIAKLFEQLSLSLHKQK